MIQIENLHKSFGKNAVLSGVSLAIDAGESHVVIGGSGTGKSVLLKCILGLIAPDSGRIMVGGADVLAGSREDFLAQFGMLFQGAALFDSMLVWENVAFRLLGAGVVRAEAKEMAIEKLRRVGLKPETCELYPAELSGGMQKRVGLARAITGAPKIIFFDEPTTGLDPIMSGVINELIRELVLELGVTAITITHDMSSVRAIGDSVTMLHGGAVQWSGAVAGLEDSGNPHLEQFLAGRAEGPIESVR